MTVTNGPALLPATRRGWRTAFAGGALTLGAYGLVLWAMTQAPIALVAALRETSVIFGVAIASTLLKERFGATRWTAAVLVVTGAAAMKLI
jgi:drug/metabolite transporter (DMT)-like permease